jgi:septum formation protein
MRLVLASTSPRRRELLALLGLSFDVCAPSFEEHPLPGLAPIEQVSRFAREKARSVSALRADDLVLGSDTVIDIDGTCVGKPAHIGDARTMLVSLAGRAHQVHTAVTLCRRATDMERTEVVTATVVMKPDDGAAIDRYLATRESLGKAGAYSIQGAGGTLIERIEGDFTAVVGLPLRAVAGLLRVAGYPVPYDVEVLYRTCPYPNWKRFSR